MLQITAGKFFDPAKGIRESPSEVIFYSNISLFPSTDLGVGKLERLHHGGPYNQYSFKYVHRMEEGGAVVKAGEEPILDQLCSLLTVFLKAYFSPRLESVETHCSPAGPKKLVLQYLDTNRMSIDMAQERACGEFVANAVALPRKDYLAVVSCCQAIRDALEALHTNSDLAYSLLVFGAESLAQRLDNYTPQWEHHPKHDALEPILAKLPPEHAEAIRGELISEANFKSLQRFVTFLDLHLAPSYFLDEAASVAAPLRKSELRAALGKVYDLRSKYAHELRGIQHQLTFAEIAQPDVFRWENEPFLTFNGLLRLLTHTLVNFVTKSPKVEREAGIKWRSDLPGIVMLKWSPEYWIFREDNVTANNARLRLQEFLSLVDILESTGTNKIADFRPALEKYRGLYPQADAENKRSIYIMMDLWKIIFPVAGPLSEDAMNFLQNNQQMITTCTSETMVLGALNETMRWPAEEMSDVYRRYEKGRVKPNRTAYTQNLEVLLMLNIAVAFKTQDNLPEYREWLEKARLEAAGLGRIQNAIKEMLDGAECTRLYTVVFPLLSAN
jgi:hypothetical protein